MIEREQYSPGPASEVQVRKEGDKWTLILVRELRHAPEKVWQALTDPVHLREWAPFDVDSRMDEAGAEVHLTWAGTGYVSATTVTRAEAPHLLEFQDMRWELERQGRGTRLTLWHKIDRRFVTWGAAGWHICFDVLDRLLAGEPMGRMVAPDVMQSGVWPRLVAEYAKQFGAKIPEGPGQPPQSS